MADTLAGVEDETLGEKTGQCEAEVPLHSLADTVAEVEAETLYESLSNFKAEALVEMLHDTLAKDGGPNKY